MGLLNSGTYYPALATCPNLFNYFTSRDCPCYVTEIALEEVWRLCFIDMVQLQSAKHESLEVKHKA